AQAPGPRRPDQSRPRRPRKAHPVVAPARRECPRSMGREAADRQESQKTEHLTPSNRSRLPFFTAHHASTFAQGTGTTLAGLAMGHLPTPRDTLKATTSQYKRPDLAPPPAARPRHRPQPPRHQL